MAVAGRNGQNAFAEYKFTVTIGEPTNVNLCKEVGAE